MLAETLSQVASYQGRVKSFTYRACNPVFVGRRQHLHVTLTEKRDRATLWAEDDDGVVGMTAEAELYDRLAFPWANGYDAYQAKRRKQSQEPKGGAVLKHDLSIGNLAAKD